MQTLMDKQKNFLLRKFHALLGKTKVGSAGKAAILESCGVSSSRDLNVHELLDVCAALELQLHPRLAESDKLRKRLMAAIGGWLKAMNKEQNAALIIAIACRAAKASDFNRIGDERLRSLCYAFNKKTKDLAFVDGITSAELDFLIAMN